MLKNTSSTKRLVISRLCFLGIAVWMPAIAYSQAIITTLGSRIPMLNGSNLSAWEGSGSRKGNANWQIIDQEIQVTEGNGTLVSRISVPDFQIEFDYWVGKDTQVTVFFRCANPNVINDDTAYELTLVNQANGLGAGSIFLLNKVIPTKIANQWNHIQISAIGTELSVTLNGVTQQVRDTRFNAGPFAINYMGGELRLKNIYVTVPGRW